MNDDAQEKLRLEQINLFNHLWDHLVKQDEDLSAEYNISRNFACSKWELKCGQMHPTEIVPDLTSLLNKNYKMFRVEISRRKYFLIKAFLPILNKHDYTLTKDQLACFNYWKLELRKKNPKLE